MRTKGIALVAAAALVAGLASTAALAHGGYSHGHGYPRARIGVYIGGPVWWGPGYYYPRPYYYAPPYYYPPIVAVPAPPPVYVERGDAQAGGAEGASNWWYYCANPPGYYPYVRQCPGGWQRVSPQPPGQ